MYHWLVLPISSFGKPIHENTSLIVANQQITAIKNDVNVFFNKRFQGPEVTGEELYYPENVFGNKELKKKARSVQESFSWLLEV